MPLYEYACRSCDDITEVLRPMPNIDDPIACISCGSPTIRVLSIFVATSKGEDGGVNPIAGSNGCMCAGSGACGCSLN